MIRFLIWDQSLHLLSPPPSPKFATVLFPMAIKFCFLINYNWVLISNQLKWQVFVFHQFWLAIGFNEMLWKKCSRLQNGNYNAGLLAVSQQKHLILVKSCSKWKGSWPGWQGCCSTMWLNWKKGKYKNKSPGTYLIKTNRQQLYKGLIL